MQIISIKVQVNATERRKLWAIMALLTLVYAVIPVGLYGSEMLSHSDILGGFWAPDSGSRFAMIQNWLEYGSLVHLHYPNANVDPTGQIHPLAYFLFHRAHDFTTMYPTLFPFTSGWAYRVFGFAGLTLVPMLCGLSCVLISYATARRLGLKSCLLLALVLGAATPLVIYSCIFWDHSALMLITASAGYWMLRSVENSSRRSAVIAGAIIGLGMFLHEQFLALFVAFWLAALPLFKSRHNILLGLPIGFFSAVLLWGVFNLHVYGLFGGPHLGANVFQNSSDHPFSLTNILNLNDFADRALAQLVGTTLPGSHFSVASSIWPYYLALACLLLVYASWAWEAHTSVGLSVSFALSLVAASVALWLVVRIHTPPAGLFEATPVLIPALAVPWYSRKTGSEVHVVNIYYAWLSRSCLLFLLLLLINPMYPGTDWGSRYLLSALPLLMLLAARAVEHQYESATGGWRRIVLIYVGGLVTISILCQSCGLGWIHRSLAYDRELSSQIRSISSPVLVTDADFNARLSSSAGTQARFLVRTDDDARIFAQVLNQNKVRDFSYVGYKGGEGNVREAISYSGRSFNEVEHRTLFKVDVDRELGDEFQLLRFTLQARDKR